MGSWLLVPALDPADPVLGLLGGLLPVLEPEPWLPPLLGLWLLPGLLGVDVGDWVGETDWVGAGEFDGLTVGVGPWVGAVVVGADVGVAAELGLWQFPSLAA